MLRTDASTSSIYLSATYCILLVLLLFVVNDVDSFSTQPTRRKAVYGTDKKRIAVCLNIQRHPDSYETFDHQDVRNMQQEERPPIPVMPSDMFLKMALSQLELLANSLIQPQFPTESKVESMGLYLPQENVNTGQLEFTPIVVYPDPSTERVFIARDAASGQAPTLPKTLTKLPGFAHATALLPGYPMISSSSDEAAPGVGVVEEVMCDARSRNKPAALSVPLLSGSQTVGVLLVSPKDGPFFAENDKKENADDEDGVYAATWTKMDREQVSRAAQSLSMALSMDNERNILRQQNTAFREGLSDSLHQVKNPLQALRTYGKILQRQIANTDVTPSDTMELLDIAERLMVQSERVVDLMVPMDSLVDSLSRPAPLLALKPASTGRRDAESIVLWEEQKTTTPYLPGTEATSILRQENRTSIAFSSSLACVNSSSSSTGDFNVDESRSNHDRKGTDKGLTVWDESSRSSSSSSSASTLMGDIQMEMTFVDDVIEPIISAFQAIATDKDIHFAVIKETPELPGVMAVPQSLQEVLSNVVDNAIKYVMLPKPGSPFTKNPSPRVVVRLFANDDPSGVVIVVEDNGPGIVHSERDKIFSRGYRSDQTKSSVDGSGIGLDIARSYMKRMGGNLSIAKSNEFPNSLDGTIMKLELWRKPPAG